jgi:hypothetical protein
MLAYLYVIIAIAFRLAPHPQSWNFTPLAASLLFFGARGSRRQMWIPVTALIATDLVLNRFVYHYSTDYSFLFTWAWYAGMILLGSGILRSRTSVARVAGASLAASTSFFLISNFFVWAAGNMYPHTFSGLATCFVAAIPFFRGTFAGDLMFTTVMFGLPAAASAWQRRNALDPAA